MLRELTKECVHCGFCLPTCPTYSLWHEEMDSPRGRIQLMEATLDGTATLSDTVVEHFDRCLGCMACLSSCPSGVRYDRLIEETRHVIEREVPRSRGERLQRRLLFATLPYPRRMRWALRLAPLGRALPSPGWAKPMLELAVPWRSREQPPAHTQPREHPVRGRIDPPDDQLQAGMAALRARDDESPPSTGQPQADVPTPRVGLLTGCVQSVMFGEVNAATARVLAAFGYEVVVPAQGCCGALSAHAGRLEEAARFTGGLSDAFAGIDTIVVNASGCGSHVKDRGLPAVDLTEALAGRPAPQLHALELTVAYQDSCHLRHAQRLPAAWRPVLELIPGLRVVEPAEQDLCCGSAGIYNITQPEAARDLGSRKAAHVLATAPDVYAAANPGCLVQVAQALGREGSPLPALHPVELLDASLRGLTVGDVLRGSRR